MTLDGEWSELLSDLEQGFELLRKLPPAVTFFGGARITEDDPYYLRSQEIGQLLACEGIPPRTGAGPGIMTSVPEGYKAADVSDRRCGTGAYAKALVKAYAEPGKPRYTPGRETLRLGRPRTQGIKIFLPFEPELNPSIDRSVELITFPVRRLMLYENALAIVVFPGGIGTLDELFEVWARRSAARHTDPIILFGGDFYGPILEGLKAGFHAGSRTLVSAEELASVSLTDDPKELLEQVTRCEECIGFDEDPEVLARRLAREIPYVAGVLSMAPPAVTVFGGNELGPDDPALAVAAEVLRTLAKDGRSVRIGSAGSLASAAIDAFSGAPSERLQGFFIGDAQGQVALPDGWGGRTKIAVTDPLAHKLLLTQQTSAFMALPGGLQTLDEVFSVLCEMQTGKRPKAPIVLIGSEVWRPLLDACSQVMYSPERKTIGPEDLDLVSVVDDVESALQAVKT